MSHLFDVNAPKKATNLSVNSDLLSRSRALNINLSSTLEQALLAKLAQAEGEGWAAENRSSIRAYNEFVEEQGSFADEFRSF